MSTTPHEPLVDARIRPLLERYASIVDAELVDVAESLVELRLPPAERKWFGKRAQLQVAFTLDALEREPDAEIAVIGSAFLDQLISAIRARGSRAFRGQLPAEHEPGAEAAELGIPITNASTGAPHVDVAWHRIVRLMARVVVRAGSEIEEHLLESGFFDATTGVAIPDEIAALCNSPNEVSASAGATNGSARTAPARPIEDLISIALASLRASLEPKVARLREDAQRKLQEELHRIDGYYKSLLGDSAARAGGSADASDGRAIEAEHARRRAEEERRHQVRAIVHPVQLTEYELLVQRAQWELVSRSGVRAPLLAARWLNGTGDWTIACPQCRSSSIRWVSVCKSGHVSCDTCALTCGVCNEDFCWDHGITACHVDGQPTCTEHARTCVSCHQPHCTAHEAICGEGEHPACSECIVACAICGRAVCDDHATLTATTSPHGQRRLCGQCLTTCEGGRSEHVGIDEVTRCTGCAKSVCETHRSTCAVDGQVQCSTHLRRTDASRRLVCETHRAECAFEPGAILASDEVGQCATCGRHACARHSHTCIDDGQRHCESDAVMLRNQPGKWVCRSHATICHVDQGAYRIGETAECPVCAKATCKSHLRGCGWCGRMVCVSDINAAHGRCGTCTQLRDVRDPADSLVDAVASALGSRQRPKRWRTARDATHTVVELDLGWTRHVVLAVRHGENVATVGRSHSAVNRKRLNLGR